MSNFLAIPTVTAAIQRLLSSRVSVDVPGAEVWTDSPDGRQGVTDPGVNVFLFSLVPNAAMRNADVATRSSDGRVRQRPTTALDLDYLLSFHGAEDDLQPQRLLGSTVRTLHATPTITREAVEAIRLSAGASPPTHHYLLHTNLDEQMDLVRLSPLPLHVDELSKLWSVFFQVPYRLSVAYRASVVLVEEDLDLEPATPVLARGLAVVPMRRPTVERIESLDAGPVVATSTIRVLGHRLRGDETSVEVAGTEVAPTLVTPRELHVPLGALAAGTLRAGGVALQIVHRVLVGVPPTPHAGERSSVAAFTVHPRVVDAEADVTGGSGTIELTVDSVVGASQRLAMVLLDPATLQRRHVFAGPERTGDVTETTFAVTGVGAGEHVVELQVDGAPSVLDTDDDGNVTGPKVTTA